MRENLKKNSAYLKSVLIHQHLGLGDHIDLNGLIRLFSKQYTFVFLIVKSRNVGNVKKMFRDNKYIKIIEYNPNLFPNEYEFVERLKNELNCKLGKFHIIEFIEIGHSFYIEKFGTNCREIFYEQFGIEFEDIKNLFYYKRDHRSEQKLLKKLNPNNEDYIFIHDDPLRGFNINVDSIAPDIKMIKNDVSELIFDFIEVLKNAKQIHCMESSFKSLIEYLPIECPKYFHNFRGHPIGKTFHAWNIVEY